MISEVHHADKISIGLGKPILKIPIGLGLDLSEGCRCILAAER